MKITLMKETIQARHQYSVTVILKKKKKKLNNGKTYDSSRVERLSPQQETQETQREESS
jgi:hypothetical protein